jgi:hypothetical protein
MDMDDCRGGDAKYGDASPEPVVDRLIGRWLGLDPGCRDELRSGEPTWPNAEVRDAFSSSSRCWR